MRHQTFTDDKQCSFLVSFTESHLDLEDVIQVVVGEEDLGEREAYPVPHHLALGPLAAIEEDGLPLPRHLWTWRTRLDMVRKIWGPTGIIGQLIPELLRYLRPDFHPWDTDERIDFSKQWQSLLSDLAQDAA